jgi:quinol monooxygenase YgiN
MISPHMAEKTLTVVAQVKAKPGKENQLRQELLALVAPSRKDAGCINYDLHQSLEDPSLFLFHENWASKTDLDAHFQTSHVQGMLAKLAELVAEPAKIMLFQKLD